MNKLYQLIFLSVFALCFTQVSAQSPFRASVSMGLSKPLKPFSNIEMTSPDAGFARQGFVLNVDGDYFLHKRFALSGRLLVSTHPIDESAYNTKLDKEVEAYKPDSARNIIYNAGNWLWISPLIGAKYNYPLVLNRAWIEGGVFTGIQFTSVPDQYLMVDDEVKKRMVISENLERSDISFPLVIEGGLRVKINELTQLNMKLSYYRSKAKYTHVSYLSDYNGIQIGERIKETRQEIPIQNLQFAVGLTYLFNK